MQKCALRMERNSAKQFYGRWFVTILDMMHLLICKRHTFRRQPTNPWRTPSLLSRVFKGHRTAQAKACPSRLNAAIAEAFVRRVQSLQTNPMVSHFILGTDFVDTVAPVLHAQTTSGSAMGADYAPGPLRWEFMCMAWDVTSRPLAKAKKVWR